MGAVGLEAGNRMKGRSRHLPCDMLGRMMRVEVRAAGVQDRDGAALVFDRVAGRVPVVERPFAWITIDRRLGRAESAAPSPFRP